jgi:phosphoglucomutase
MSKTNILALAASAAKAGKFSAAALENLTDWVNSGVLPKWATQALDELADAKEWEELNTRFFQKIDFGTAGLRGLTIGKVSPPSERGVPGPQGSPEHAAAGSNNMNDFTVAAATIGLFRHVSAWLTRQNTATPGPGRPPTLVIAHDVRHFSRHFCELAASVWTKLGGNALVFKDARSTPQLSFTVRHLKADAGVVVTASHNPPEYNGFKCYFRDGAQIIPPHDAATSAAVAATGFAELAPFLEKDLAAVEFVPAKAEAAYFERLADNALDADVFARGAPAVVYTNLHGTGDVVIPRLLERFHVHAIAVEAQRPHDPAFGTVASPNPENPATFTLAIAEATRANADIAIGTDPDDDRVGAAVRERDGSYRVLSGNEIGSALAAYRIARMKELGLLPAAGTRRATLVKTFVTSPLQDAIAAREGVRCVNTLTGFKWIGAKLGKYQCQLEAALEASGATPKNGYDSLPWREKARLHLAHSTFFVFGGEESMGYLGTDATRDKDGNAAALMIVELAAWLKARGKTFSEYLDEIYLHAGAVFQEALLNVQFEPGAAGLAKIQAILASLRGAPPKKVDGSDVLSFKDFGRQDLFDADGEAVPKEDFFFFTLADGRQFAVRGSGTEPKIKFYIFGRVDVRDAGKLAAAKQKLAVSVASLETSLKTDAHRRARSGAGG